jgi:hypothetical protein
VATPLRQETPKSPKTTPPNPQSYGLGAVGGVHLGEDSSIPSSRRQQRIYSQVAESLWDNLEFVQAGFHIGRYITAVVNTEAERANTQKLY